MKYRTVAIKLKPGAGINFGMRKLLIFLSSLFGVTAGANSESIIASPLDYDQLLYLDAEALAEKGILDA